MLVRFDVATKTVPEILIAAFGCLMYDGPVRCNDGDIPVCGAYRCPGKYACSAPTRTQRVHSEFGVTGAPLRSNNHEDTSYSAILCARLSSKMRKTWRTVRDRPCS